MPDILDVQQQHLYIQELYAVSRFQQLAEDEALFFKLGKWAQQVGLSVKWD